MKKSKSPTMQTVADAAEVSVMTVSRALKNHPKLPPSTCLRIQQLAEQLGYRPNPMVSTLMSHLRSSRTIKHTPVIVFLTAFPERDIWRLTQTHMNKAFHGAAQRCDDLGFRLEPFWIAEPGLTAERTYRILATRAIPGVIVAPLPLPPPALDFKVEYFACACIGHSLKNPILHRATNDHFNTIELLLRKLDALGYKRIGLTLRYADDFREDHRWIAGLSAYQFYKPQSQRVRPLFTHDWNFKNFSTWFHKNRPDAVIGLHPNLEHEQWLNDMGVKVPDDVGLAFLEYVERSPTPSGINQNAELVGAAAVDLVVEQLNYNQRGIPMKPKIVMIEGEWVLGTTVRSML